MSDDNEACQALLLAHAAVDQCVVVARQTPRHTEELTAVIVLKTGMNVFAEELARYLKERSGSITVPNRFFFVNDPLPVDLEAFLSKL